MLFQNTFNLVLTPLLFLFLCYALVSLLLEVIFKFARNPNFQEMLGHVDAMYSQGPPSVASGPRSYTQSGMFCKSLCFVLFY